MMGFNTLIGMIILTSSFNEECLSSFYYENSITFLNDFNVLACFALQVHVWMRKLSEARF